MGVTLKILVVAMIDAFIYITDNHFDFCILKCDLFRDKHSIKYAILESLKEQPLLMSDDVVNKLQEFILPSPQPT